MPSIRATCGTLRKRGAAWTSTERCCFIEHPPGMERMHHEIGKSAGLSRLWASPLLVRELVQTGPAVGPRDYAQHQPNGDARGVINVAGTASSTRLRALREEHGLTQQEVAEQLGNLAFL